VISGKINLLNQELSDRDAIGITETEQFSIKAGEESRFVIIEVPMN
jgi:hypothetical protein